MADFNQNKPGEQLTDMSEKFRTQNLIKNVYPVSDSDGYSPNHPNALANGDDKGTRTDIHGNGEVNTGRVNNLKTNLYSKNNTYSAGNIDSGPGFEATTSTPPA